MADNVLFSSCDGDEKDWQISGKNLDVTINGYGSIDDASLMAKDAPIAYSPYFFFLLRSNARVVFLFAELGYSTRKGSRHQQPYYWAINDNTDATFYANAMTLGIKTGLEYRYNLDKESLGILAA